MDLLPLASVAYVKRIQSNTLVVKQGDTGSYIYFAKNGRLKVSPLSPLPPPQILRKIDFIKKLKDQDDLDLLYKNPTQEDHDTSNVRNQMLEIAEIGRYQSFGDSNLPASKTTE